MWQMGFDDEGTALKRLSQMGDKLEWLNKAINWTIFLPLLAKAKPDRTREGKGGRPPLPPLMMFKIAILQQLNNTSDDATEFLLNDRLSWKRFIGLGLAQKAPDAKSIWLFRDTLQRNGIYAELFDLFNAKMEEIGVITHQGSIVDASFVDVPRQRNTREVSTKPSKPIVFPKPGVMRDVRTCSLKRIPMPAGQRRTTKYTMDIKTTYYVMRKVS